MAIGLFGLLLYIGLLYAGLVEFIGRLPKKASRKKRRRNMRARGFRNREFSKATRVCLTRPQEQGNKVRVKIVKYPVHIRKKVGAAVVIAVAMVVAVALLESGCSRGEATNAKAAPSTNSTANPTVDLSPTQLNSIKIETVGSYRFPIEKEAVGTISFADDLSVDVFQPIRARSSRPLLNSGPKSRKISLCTRSRVPI